MTRHACRIVLLCGAARLEALGDVRAEELFAALGAAGDVASVIFHAGEIEQATFQTLVRKSALALQAVGVAVVIDGDSQTVGRIKADGLQIPADAALLRDLRVKHEDRLIIGCSNVKGRHNALLLGEEEPDYLMFGKRGGDTHGAANPKNLDLGAWWSAMVEIPCIVQGGQDLDSVVTVAQCGADFVGLETAIFGDEKQAIDIKACCNRLKAANQLLDDHAPPFETDF
ncbi:MAG: thiamine phosphate synthase [Pseudomonadota bacterium]